ncbi:MAG: acetate--CoA ligase family protein [Candidatus Korarchaeota archaeon]|nr:acetate--CoA ligase family protein [Candidatus Korarchaeota archaeon]
MPKGREIIQGAISEGRKVLLEPEAKALIADYGIPVTRVKVAKTEEEAVQFAREIGLPVVLKIVSPDVLHKSDVGGVKVNLKTEEEVRRAYREIIESVKSKVPNAKIVGVLIQEFAPAGVEVIIGLIKDPQFGPTVMFGLGGVFVEVFRDVSFRVAPLTERDAEEMISEIKGRKLLEGDRGMEPVDKKALVDALVKVGQIGVENPEIKEMDLNPVMAYPSGLKVVDARVILG